MRKNNFMLENGHHLRFGNRLEILLKVFRVYFIMGAIVAHVYAPYNAFAMLYSKNELWSTLTFAWFTHSSVAAFDVVIYKRKKLALLLTTLRRYYFSLEDRSKKAVDVFCRRMWCCVGLLALLKYCYDLYFYMGSRTGKVLYDSIWFDFMCLKCDQSALPPHLVTAMRVLEPHCTFLALYSPWMFFPSAYFTLTRVLQERTEQFNQRMRAMERDLPTIEAVRQLMLDHRQLRETLQLFNDVFSVLVIWWFGTASVSTYQGVIHMTNAVNPNGVVYFFFLIVDLIPLFVILGVTFLASRVALKADESLLCAQNLSYGADPTCIPALSVLCRQLKRPLLGATAGNCFLLTRELCLGFIATAITFVVVFIQMNPDLNPT